jgi:hypothetical protein
MTKREYLLIKLAEECNEVAQRCTKALTFGLYEVQEGQELNNQQRIEYELNDLLGMIDICKNEGILDREFESSDAIIKKTRKVEQFMEYSKRQGVL